MSGLSKKDLCFLNCAKEVAKLSNFYCKVGCVVVQNNSIISSGVSSSKTHPLQLKYNVYRFGYSYNSKCIPSVHAEISALSKLVNHETNNDFSNLKVYVYRIRNKTDKGMARPCAACMALIKKLGIKTVVYSTNEGYAKELLDIAH